MTSRGMVSWPMLKYLRERCVCAPQYLSAGTAMGPMLGSSSSRGGGGGVCVYGWVDQRINRPIDRSCGPLSSNMHACMCVHMYVRPHTHLSRSSRVGPLAAAAMVVRRREDGRSWWEDRRPAAVLGCCFTSQAVAKAVEVGRDEGDDDARYETQQQRRGRRRSMRFAMIEESSGGGRRREEEKRRGVCGSGKEDGWWVALGVVRLGSAQRPGRCSKRMCLSPTGDRPC